jgi:hypothetical protein
MKTFKTGAFLAALLIVLSQAAAFAACTHDSDRAADGSRCGKRSSDSREGGK